MADGSITFQTALDNKVLEKDLQNTLSEHSASLKIQADQISAEVEERQSDVESINGQLNVQAGEIAAKVSKTGGASSSFGWVLDEKSWTIKASNRDVLKATEAGLEIYGTIKATGGTIGGFTIQSNYLSYNGQTWLGTNSTGIYIGSSGIQCGPSDGGFRVDNRGNLYASSGHFSGTVDAGNISYGGSSGYFSGGGISSGSIYGNRLAANTVTTAYTSGGINSSLGYADFANGVFNGWNTASNLKATDMTLGGYKVRWAQIKFMSSATSTTTMYVLTRV